MVSGGASGGYSGSRALRSLAVPLAAVAGCLQPAIDPVFLALASAATPLSPSHHGLVVAATQGGAALGALAMWWRGLVWGTRAGVIAGLLALAASLLTPFAPSTTALLALRCAYGLGMGAIYARAMGEFAGAGAGHSGSRAYAVVLLVQLIAATALSLVLPALAQMAGARGALLVLALVPGLAALAMGQAKNGGATIYSALAPHGNPVPLGGWVLALASLCFVGTTMMVWSLSGALAMHEGFSESEIGRAVAIGSLVGAGTALVVMREKLVVPLPVTGLLCTLALLAPLVLTRAGDGLAFNLGIALLNIGSTVIIVRSSGLASEIGHSRRFRVFVAATHPLGMTGGPMLGSVLLWGWGQGGLLAGAGLLAGGGVLCLASACIKLRGLAQFSRS